jgi:hypothetical protein
VLKVMPLSEPLFSLTVAPGWSPAGQPIVRVRLRLPEHDHTTELHLSLASASLFEQGIADALAYIDRGPPPAEFYDDPSEEFDDP